MSTTNSFPYDTRLNILQGPLEVIDVGHLADTCTHQWYNQTLCRVNDSVVRLGVVQGEYHWHQHERDDEPRVGLAGPRADLVGEPDQCVALHSLSTQAAQKKAPRGSAA